VVIPIELSQRRRIEGRMGSVEDAEVRTGVNAVLHGGWHGLLGELDASSGQTQTCAIQHDRRTSGAPWFAPDSPQEEAVSSEPVSKVGVLGAEELRHDSEAIMDHHKAEKGHFGLE
jgi:hypothetical protein